MRAIAGPRLLPAFAVVLAALSRLPLVAYLARVGLTVPFLALAVTLPAALNLVTPGTALVVLSEDPLVSVTAPGLAVATRLALRETFQLIFHKEGPEHQSEVDSFLRQKLIPLGFVEEKGSRPFEDFTVFRRERFVVERFVVEFGIDIKDGVYFFRTSHGEEISDVYLIANMDPLNKETNIANIETFKVDLHNNLDKWLAEVGLIAV